MIRRSNRANEEGLWREMSGSRAFGLLLQWRVPSSKLPWGRIRRRSSSSSHKGCCYFTQRLPHLSPFQQTPTFQCWCTNQLAKRWLSCLFLFVLAPTSPDVVIFPCLRCVRLLYLYCAISSSIWCLETVSFPPYFYLWFVLWLPWDSNLRSWCWHLSPLKW